MFHGTFVPDNFHWRIRKAVISKLSPQIFTIRRPANLGGGGSPGPRISSASYAPSFCYIFTVKRNALDIQLTLKMTMSLNKHFSKKSGIPGNAMQVFHWEELQYMSHNLLHAKHVGYMIHCIRNGSRFKQKVFFNQIA